MKERLQQERLAVLIDADNSQPNIIQALLEEIAKYGTATVKRIYGDWTNPHLKGWKDHLLEHAIQPFQQFGYTRGKNATDSALIIDAMDLLYSVSLDGFCLVSSDSDFTRLAARIRESGLKVYGFGEKKTPRAFVAACDKFVYTEILREDGEQESAAQDKGKKKSRSITSDKSLMRHIKSAVNDSADDSGWAFLGEVGNNLVNKMPEFDSRNYGYQKLGEMMRDIPFLKIDERNVKNSPGKLLYVRVENKGGRKN